jgi:hypothetical protein
MYSILLFLDGNLAIVNLMTHLSTSSKKLHILRLILRKQNPAFVSPMPNPGTTLANTNSRLVGWLLAPHFILKAVLAAIPASRLVFSRLLS